MTFEAVDRTRKRPPVTSGWPPFVKRSLPASRSHKRLSRSSSQYRNTLSYSHNLQPCEPPCGSLPHFKPTADLALPIDWQHIAAMPSDRLTETVKRAVQDAPCSIRALARAAGVPDSTLVRIVAGERAATPAVATAIARALEGWGAQCGRHAAAIRKAQPGGVK